MLNLPLQDLDTGGKPLLLKPRFSEMSFANLIYTYVTKNIPVWKFHMKGLNKECSLQHFLQENEQVALVFLTCPTIFYQY